MSNVISRREPTIWALWHDEEKPVQTPYPMNERAYWYTAQRYFDKCIFFYATEEEMDQPPFFKIEEINVEYIIQCDDDPELGWKDEVNITDYHGHGYRSPVEYFDSWTRHSDGYSYRLITRTTRSNIAEEPVKVKEAK